jgi:cytochrome c peroxidase
VKRAISIIAATAVAVVAFYGWQTRIAAPAPWTDDELAVLQSLWIGNLPPIPPDPSNAVADNADAARFGQQLFFDARLSSNGGISCATCHQPERRFTDGLPKGQAIGTSKRNTRSIVGVVYSPWLYWDGRRDSLWAQALAPLEDPDEHGSDRRQVVAVIANDEDYRTAYESLFGALPEAGDGDAVSIIFANIGKAIAAYERLLIPGASRFDTYVESTMRGGDGEASPLFSNDEIRGLRLFIGEANCTQCHNGPLFTNHEFHNTGVLSLPGEVPDKGRVQGVREVLADPFNCRGPYSDDPAPTCAELEYARTGPELIGTVRTPSLRNLQNTAPFMHKGQIGTLAGVLEHYNLAPPAMIGHNEAKPLGLSRRELGQLEAFLDTLAAPLATAEEWLGPPATRLDADNDQD